MPEASDKIITIPNVISTIRLCLAPLFLALLLSGNNIAATVVFLLGACTDWIDGTVARATNSVSKVGQLLDPAVDRILMITGVLGLYAVGRLPLWIIVLVVVRDVGLFVGSALLLSKYQVRVPVIFAGKVTTTCFFVGLGGLMLNMPLLQGLGITSLSWLPGFNTALCSWGIWVVYLGLILGLGTTAYYVYKAICDVRSKKEQKLSAEQIETA